MILCSVDLWEKVLDILFKIISFAGWIVGALALWKAKKKLQTAEKTQQTIAEEMTKNKEDQKEQEKELQNMAKFLCDKCGAETPVAESQTVTIDDQTFDVCGKCAAEWAERQVQVENARREVEQAEAALNAAKEKLRALTNPTVVSDNNDILSKLGL